ncbi:MAG: spermidine dehydrogenase [Halieaceae bacterium]|jgi:spermidine dehydrogenase
MPPQRQKITILHDKIQIENQTTDFPDRSASMVRTGSKPSDRNLGMNQPISRRDMLHGMGAITAGSLLPDTLLAEQLREAQNGSVYPPILSGIRGNHAGSFEVAHQLGRAGRTDWGKVQHPDPGAYDLVVVGGGISGLSSAHFFRKENPNARILILDNHDDFGGHAKRNEFEADGRTVIGYGGSQTLSAPSGFSDIVNELLDDLGVDTKRFEKAYDQGFYKRHGLGAGIHFNKEAWGVDRTVPFGLGFFQDYLAMAKSPLTAEEAVEKIPISDAARRELLHLLTTDEDQIPHIHGEAKWDYLSSISYREFLSRHLGITEPEVFALLQDLPIDLGVGIEAAPASMVLDYIGMPGWDAAGLPEYDEDDEPYIHHFPDGNASIARLLVRSMIPSVAPGSTMEDVVTAQFDYARLDQPNAPVRVRLNSTVTLVEHVGDALSATQVSVSYVRDGQAYRVMARGCVLACNNSIIPYLCPTLPTSQREALANQVKSPILYTNVLLRNWQAWKKMGIGAILSPGSYHITANLDFPVSLGDYTFSGGPDEPIVVHMERFPHVNNQGLSKQEQFRLGRQELLSTPFATIEREVRAQLLSMLGEAGFDPARDITSITVNRWAHGYAYGYSPLFDTVYADRDDARYPHMRARKPFGRITIANADSAASAMLQAAVEQAHRAITELVSVY